jgi:hypothetical protein
MRASGLRGAEGPADIEYGNVTEQQSRSMREIAYPKFIFIQDPWFDQFHISYQPCGQLLSNCGFRVRPWLRD